MPLNSNSSDYRVELHENLNMMQRAIIFNEKTEYENFIKSTITIEKLRCIEYDNLELYFYLLDHISLLSPNIHVTLNKPSNTTKAFEKRHIHITTSYNHNYSFEGKFKLGLHCQTNHHININTTDVILKLNILTNKFEQANWHEMDIYIIDCPNINKVVLDQNSDYKTIKIRNSIITEVEINLTPNNNLDIDRNKHIGKLIYDNKSVDNYLLSRIEEIEFLKLGKGKISLYHCNLRVMETEEPDTENITFRYCTFKYDRRLLKKYHPKKYWDIWATGQPLLHFETDKDIVSNNIKFRKYINSAYNTYEFLKALPSLNSEKLIIYRYAQYFRSFKSFIGRILYLFHGGFYKIIQTFVFFLISMIAAYYCLDNVLDDFPGIAQNPIEYQLNPKLLLKDLLFNRLPDQDAFILEKGVILLLILFSYYTLFAFMAAIKRRFGYPKP